MGLIGQHELVQSLANVAISPRRYARSQKLDVACPAGVEPATCCLEGSCSIQLSYGHLKTARASTLRYFLEREVISIRAGSLRAGLRLNHAVFETFFGRIGNRFFFGVKPHA